VAKLSHLFTEHYRAKHTPFRIEKRFVFFLNFGIADWRDEFERGGVAATLKFIFGLSNALNFEF
jgi:hypothetical protein